MPNFFQLTVTAPRPVEIGIGNSPPTRNFASCPDSATSVGSASILARPLDSSAVRIALNGNLRQPREEQREAARRPRAPAPAAARPSPSRGSRRTSRPRSTGRPCPPTKRPPGSCANRLMPSSRRPLRDTSANFTSSCTCWLPTTWIRLAIFSACSWATSAARSGTRTSDTSPDRTIRSPAAETAIFSVGKNSRELGAQPVEVARHGAARSRAPRPSCSTASDRWSRRRAT